MKPKPQAGPWTGSIRQATGRPSRYYGQLNKKQQHLMACCTIKHRSPTSAQQCVDRGADLLNRAWNLCGLDTYDDTLAALEAFVGDVLDPSAERTREYIGRMWDRHERKLNAVVAQVRGGK